jgi:hypothetical protein
MSQTPQSEAEHLVNLLESMSVKDLKQIRTNLEVFIRLVDIILGKAAK